MAYNIKAKPWHRDVAQLIQWEWEDYTGSADRIPVDCMDQVILLVSDFYSIEDSVAQVAKKYELLHRHRWYEQLS